MNNENKIKQLISEALTHFLISRKVTPHTIELKVIYDTGTARLTIDAEKIAEALKE